MGHLASVRREAGLTQMEVARRMGKPPSFVNKCELGERRMDVVEIRAFCKAVGVPFVDFLVRFESLAEELDS